MFVLVNTFMEYDHAEDVLNRLVGAVYGPFPSKDQAEQARVDMEFSHPEHVFVRAVYPA